MKTSNSVPVLILGGQENTISLLRSFGKRNIKVYISVRHNSLAIKSRHCHKVFTIPDGKTDGEAWQELLLFDERPELRGCVIFPGSDEAVDFLASNRRRLKKGIALIVSGPVSILPCLINSKRWHWHRKQSARRPPFLK